MIKLVIALVVLAHGIGHSMGILQIFRVASINPTWKGDSWLLTDVAGATVTRAVGATLWIGALAGFVVLAGVIVGWFPETWWAPLAIGASLLSMMGLVLFPTAFPIFSTIGAFLVNAAILVAVLWIHWVPSDLTS